MRVLNSGILNMFCTALKNFSIFLLEAYKQLPSRGSDNLFDHGGGAACFLDLVFRSFGKTVRRDLERLGHVPVSKDHKIVLCLLNKASFVQDLRGDLVTRIEILFDLGKADLDPLFLKDVSKATLRQSTLQRHLATLKA